jgi:hypothetical protein
MEHAPSFDDGRPAFDHAFARDLVGKYVLVGVTVKDKRGELKRHEQFHGIVVSADAVEGIYLSLKGDRAGETKWLPPATHVYFPAPKGEYRLKSSGEVVTDPDFTSQWILEQADA